MTSTKFDVVWLGTGQATLTIVPQIIAAGKRVAVVEGGHFGGTCVNTGCTPTKTLVASAAAIQTARRGDEFGFSIDGLNVDFKRVMATQQKNRRNSSTWIEKRLNELTNGAVFNGYGRFASDHEIVVGDQTITGDTIVIHTGTQTNKPNLPGIDSVPYLTNETILDLQELPEHLVVVGGSYIALEFGQLFRRLGSKVTILEREPRLVAREDPDISELIATRLTDEDIDVQCGCNINAVSNKQGVTVNYLRNDSEQTLSGSHVLFAVGRSPNSERLKPQLAGVQTNERGFVTVNDVMQTSVPHIYAVGDINGRGAFTHTAVNDGEIFWDHYQRQAGISTEQAQWDRSLATRTMTYAMFVDPPLARIGMNEFEARQSGRNVLMGSMPMAQIARAREKRETFGLVKVLVDADSEQLLGATIFGSSGDEVIGALAMLIQTQVSYKVFRRLVLPHPTVSELMPWIFDNLTPLP